MLKEDVAMGGLRLELVRRVVTRSPDLTAFLTALDTGGPLITPISSLTPVAPTRGAAYNRAVDEGVEAFWIQIMRQEVPASANGASAKSVRRPAAGKLIENAAALALKGYPASTMKQAGKLMPL